MKKPTKSIITSSLLALAFGAMSVSTTFALFTSQSKTEINVGSGEVRVGQTLAIQSVSELGDVAVQGIEGVFTNSIGGKTYIDANNANVLHLEKWAPGDKAVIMVTNNNYSNVMIKTRFTVSHSSTSTPDLYGALSLNYLATDADNVNIGYKFMDWSPVSPTVTKISNVLVTIEFPDRDNGEILFGDANHDNQYQNCNCSIMFTQEAVQANAHTNGILDQLNAALDTASATDGRNKTMYDALQDVSSVLNESLIKSAGYVWNTSTDHFYYGQEGTTNEYFKICDTMPGTQTNSIYASSSWNTAIVNLTGVGFDAGSASGITEVNYTGASSATSNVIRTNSATTSVNVDAPQDTISHYGLAGSLNINAIAGNSYHEHGKVVFAEIRKGRIALEKGAIVEQIHVSAKLDNNQQKLDEFEEIIIARDEAVTMPTLSRDDVSIADEGTLVVALQEGTETVTEQTELDYVWLTKQGIYEQITVSDSSESAGNTWVNTSDKSAETKEAAQQIANNIGRDNNGSVNDVVTVSNQEYTVTLDEETREIIITDSNEAVVEDTTVIALATQEAVEERGMTEEEKEAVKEAAIDEVITEEVEKEAEASDKHYVARIGLVGYERLDTALAACRENTKVVLLEDHVLPIDFTPVEMFEGTFDGQNHKIYTRDAINAEFILETLTKTVTIKDLTIAAYGHLSFIAGRKYNYEAVTFDNVDYIGLDDTYYQLEHNGSLYTTYCYDWATKSWGGTVTVKNCDVNMNLKGAASSNSAVFFGGFFYPYDECYLNVIDCTYTGTFIGNYVALVISNGQNYSSFNDHLNIVGLRNLGTLIGAKGAYAVGAQCHTGSCSDLQWITLYDEVQASAGGTYTVMDTSKLSVSINEDNTVKITDNGIDADHYEVLLYASRNTYNADGYLYASSYNFGITFNVENPGDTEIKKFKMVDYETAIEDGLILASDCSEIWTDIGENAQYQIVTSNDVSYYVIKFGQDVDGDTYEVPLQDVTVFVSAYDANGILKAVAEI